MHTFKAGKQFTNMWKGFMQQVQLSLVMFCSLLNTHDDWAMQVLVWLCTFQFTAVRFDAVWFYASYVNFS
jgi:ABC-type uncharacterized transport system YnjBCD substrate-binding protein